MRTPHLPLQQAPPSGDCASRPTRRVRSRPSWASGRPQTRPGLWVRLPERQFPAASELGQWVRGRLQTGEWDDWLCSLRVCLPARRLVFWSVASCSFLRGAVKLPGISGSRIFCESWLLLCPHLALKFRILSCMIRRRENCLCSVLGRRFWRGPGVGGASGYPP